jgi:DtxR family Mn-dependent transcriptional regulator
MASEQIENYLKHIYMLQSDERLVSTSSLSRNLEISPASVSEMVKKLADDGQLTHTPYKGVSLTEEGEHMALRVIRRHRLWEMFLFEVLHFKWDEIHQEAERFEHIMSDRMEEKIDEVLGFPRVDPHGHPIPTRDGVMKPVAGHLLIDAAEGARLRVLLVNDADSELLQYVASIGLTLHQEISVKQKIKFDNSMLVTINTREINISPAIASSILVENLS